MLDKTRMKPLKDLVLMDRFLFAAAMEDPVICRNMLEIILGKQMLFLSELQAEKEIRTSPLFRSIRLDVYTVDEEKSVYSVEAQKVNTGNLPRRSRYYQSLIDSTLLEPGCVDFNQLNDSFMITVMPFDLYGKGLYRYTFTMRCEEDLTLRMEDGATRIFLNLKGKNEEAVGRELVELLHYIEKTDDASSEASSSARIKEIHEHILKIKSSEEIGVKYMQAWEEKVLERAEGKAEGEAEGEVKGEVKGEAKIIAIIRKKAARGLDVPAISDILELDPIYVEKVMDLISEDRERLDLEIARILVSHDS